MDDHAGGVDHAAQRRPLRAGEALARAGEEVGVVLRARPQLRAPLLDRGPRRRDRRGCAARRAPSPAADRREGPKTGHRGEGYAALGRVRRGGVTDLCRVCGGSRRTAAGEGGCPGWSRISSISRAGPAAVVARIAAWDAISVDRRVAEGARDRRNAARGADRSVSPAGQHGVVTSAQLVAAGWSRDVIARSRARLAGCGASIAASTSSARSRRPHTARDGGRARHRPGVAVAHYPAAVLWDCAHRARARCTSRRRPARAAAPASPSTEPPCTPRTSPDATASPSPPPPEPSSTSPPPTPPPRPRARRQRGAACSAASARIPSMSSSAVTPRTEERQH